MQRLFLSEAGEPVSAVTASEAMQLIRLTEITGAPGPAEMIESGGRSAYDMVMRIIRGRSGPVVIVAGPGYTGAIGLSLARHLANHGMTVSAYPVGNPERAENGRQLAGLTRALAAEPGSHAASSPWTTCHGWPIRSSKSKTSS